MDVILGLDIGTTEVKAITWDEAGRSHSEAVQKVHLFTPQAGWVEQDARELWSAVVNTCSQAAIAAHSAGDRIRAVSISTQGGTTIPVDAAGKPTHFAFSWMDERAGEEAGAVAERLGQEQVYRTTGWPLTPGLPLNQIAWFRKHRPAQFEQTHRFLFVNDYILYQLTRELAMDPSNAGITQLYNLARDDWDDSLLAIAGANRQQLSPLLPSGQPAGQVTRHAADLTGLLPGTPVYNGAHDQYCAALGAGAAEPGDVLLSCGTAWVALFVLDQPGQGFARGLSVSRHPRQGAFGGILDIGGVGSTMEWLIDHLWDERLARYSRFALLEQAIRDSSPGAHGLAFIPLSGGYLPDNAPIQRGPVGLSLNHTRADLARAAMEGITFELDLLLKSIGGKIPIRRLMMIGGAARNPYWPQMITDITGMPIAVSQVKGAASFGAALLAGAALGWDTDQKPGDPRHSQAPKEFMPDPQAQDAYAGVKSRYFQARRKST